MSGLTQLIQGIQAHLTLGFTLVGAPVTNSTNTNSLSLVKTVVAGDLLIVPVGIYNDTAISFVTGVTDSQSNVWSLAIDAENGSNPALTSEIFFATAASSGSLTVTVALDNMAGNIFSVAAGALIEVKGQAGSPLDGQGDTGGAGATAFSGTSSANAGHDLMVGVVANNTGLNGTVNSPWTLVYGSTVVGIAYIITTDSSTAYNAGFPITSGGNTYVGCIASFKHA